MNGAGTIYVDFDDILCETARPLAGLLQREFGKIVAFEHIHTFNLATAFGLQPDELHRLMELGHQPEFLAGLPPVAGASEALCRWQASGYEIAVVTGRPPVTFEASRDWLERHALPIARLVFVDKYGRTLLPGGTTPAITLEQLYAETFCLAVEDAPTMAANLLQHMTMPVAVLNRPWNIDATIGNGNADARLVRCRDWSHLLDRFPNP